MCTVYLHTNRINKVSIESVAELLDTGSDLIKHNALLASICKTENLHSGETSCNAELVCEIE